MPRQGMRKEAGETPGRGGPGKHGTPVTAETPDHAWPATVGHHPAAPGPAAAAPPGRRAGPGRPPPAWPPGTAASAPPPDLSGPPPGQAKPEEIHAIRLAWEDAATPPPKTAKVEMATETAIKSGAARRVPLDNPPYTGYLTGAAMPWGSHEATRDWPCASQGQYPAPRGRPAREPVRGADFAAGPH
jgi:hypothetical protein